MQILDWEFGAAALAFALTTALLTGKLIGIVPARGRNTAIDGLRGYLAFGVILHHVVIWYFYLRTSVWEPPADSIYRELGATSVSVFFMITSYLFIGKLLDAKRRPVNWTMLYVSRFLRLAPLYFIAMCWMYVMAAAVSDWRLHEPISVVLGECLDWLSFSVLASPDINAVRSTGLLTAGVTWSLRYEWLFYLALPVLALLFRVKVSLGVVLLCAATLGVLLCVGPRFALPVAFVKGAIGSVVSRNIRVSGILQNQWFGVVILAGAFAALSGHTAEPRVSLLILAAFCVVACGNTAFGLLSNRAAVALGDVSYGLYLLHGLILFATFTFVIGRARAAQFSPLEHWLAATGVGMTTVFLASLTYRYVEEPSMRQVKPVSEWIHLRRARLSTAAKFSTDESP